MGNNSSTSSKTSFSYLNDWAKSIDITIEYENCDSNKKIFTQFEDKDQINKYNCNANIYN